MAPLAVLVLVAYAVAFSVLRPDRAAQTWEPGEIASHLLAGEGYSLHRFSGFVQSSANQEPVYPLLLAFFLAAAPNPYPSLAFFQIAVWLGGAFFYAGLAHRLIGSPKTWTGLAVALWPPMVVYVLSYHPLWLRTSTLILVIAAAVFCRDKPTYRRAFLLGLALGVAALVRSPFLLLPLLIVPWTFLTPSREPLSMRAKQASVSLMTAGLVFSPWIIRNRVTLGSWIPGTTTAGYIALMGNHPGATGSLDAEALRRVAAELSPEFWSQPETARDAAFRAQVADFWTHHTGEALKLYLKKLLCLWTWRPGVGEQYPTTWKIIYQILWIGTLPLIAAGWNLARGNPRAEGPHLLLVMWVLYSLAYAFFAVNMRYRFETEPLLIPYAALAMRAAIRRAHVGGQARKRL